jgi:hypothetical protein
MRPRGQGTIEFAFALVLVSVAFLALFQLYLDSAHSAGRARTLAGGERAALDVARVLNGVARSTNGTFANLTPPALLETSENYSLALIGRRVEVTWEGGARSAELLTDSVEGAGLLAPGVTRRARNRDGGVVIEPA